jgi:UDP-N-acetylmuramyl pentapeptide phosphotransferase/UDP-N-acetylglucosamine-1-phosphate transferase
MIDYWLLPLFASGVSAGVIALRLRFGDHGLDHPNQRSLHERPTPHGGGLGIVAALLLTGLPLGVPIILLVSTFALAALSLVDDARPLPSWLRLVVHLGAAGFACWLAGLPTWLWPVAMLAVAWMTNLYNFMDGADGLAGSQGAAGFLAYALGLALGGETVLAAWCAAVSFACIGFLYFNWPPARIFMGDVGSIPLGFLAGSIGLMGIWRGYWPLWYPVLVFAPFILDASLTLLRRTLRGARVWEAHREHCYQRMVRLGYGHRGMTLRWAAVMAAGATLAAGLLMVPTWLQWAATTGWLSSLGLAGLWIDRRWRSHDLPA